MHKTFPASSNLGDTLCLLTYTPLLCFYIPLNICVCCPGTDPRQVWMKRSLPIVQVPVLAGCAGSWVGYAGTEPTAAPAVCSGDPLPKYWPRGRNNRLPADTRRVRGGCSRAGVAASGRCSGRHGAVAGNGDAAPGLLPVFQNDLTLSDQLGLLGVTGDTFLP